MNMIQVCLIDWGEGPASFVPGSKELETSLVMNGEVTLTLAQEEAVAKRPFHKRTVDIMGNPLIKPLPPPGVPLYPPPPASLRGGMVVVGGGLRWDVGGRVAAPRAVAGCRPAPPARARRRKW